MNEFVCSEVEKSIANLKTLYDSWSKQNGNRLTRSPQFNPEQFKWTIDEIKSNVKTIEWDIQDLEETVGIVEANPQKFHLDAAEVARRRQFVEQSKSTIARISSEVSKQSSSAPSSNTGKVVDDPLRSAASQGSGSRTNQQSSQHQKQPSSSIRADPTTSNSGQNNKTNTHGDDLIQRETVQQQV